MQVRGCRRCRHAPPGGEGAAAGGERQARRAYVALFPHVSIGLLGCGEELGDELLVVVLRRRGEPTDVQIVVVINGVLVHLLRL